jgi:glycosyltransferase involved in cell wall biosynthesis
MKVGVIAAEMEGRATGVGRYLSGLLRGLQAWDHGFEWHYFFQGDPPASPRLPDGPYHEHYSRHHGSRGWWEQVVVARDLGVVAPNVVFGPAYNLPFGLKAPGVVTLRGLSFEVLPQEFDPRERWRRRLLARRAARVARRVITDTEHMSSLVGARYGVPADRRAVVPLAVDDAKFTPDARDEDGCTLTNLGVRSPYILFPGTVLERRHPRSVLEGFARVRHDHPEQQLVIAGANRLRRAEDLAGWTDRLGLTAAVRLLGWVEESALAPLYRGAELGVYVSSHEGFGLPPLECLACGTPVIVGNGLALDDVWPDYPFRLRTVDSEGIAAAMRGILDDPAVAAQAMTAAPAAVAGLNWEQSSRRLVAELERAVQP